MTDEHDTERLRTIQQRRAEEEAERAERASDDTERRAHERRADKAEYLRDKLAEQERTPDR